MNTSTLSLRPLPPFEWASSNLGFSNRADVKTKICFFDQTGQMWQTDSVEYVLRFIDCFEYKYDRYRLLAAAALHYGFDDAWILIKGRYFDAAETISFPLVVRTLFYCGGTVGLGHPLAHCGFWIMQNGEKSSWTVFETLARIDEFSPAAQARILKDCADQIAKELQLASSTGVAD